MELAESTTPVKLDFACGQTPRPGFQGVDLYAPEATKVDLFKFPYPWADSSVDEIYCSHFIEHLPARDVETRDLRVRDTEKGHPPYEDFLDKDFLFCFFDECHRILKPGGVITVIVPALKSVRAFQDPTHRRFITQETFLYLSKDWRKRNKLDHYRVQCDFKLNVQHTCSTEVSVRADAYQEHVFKHEWDRMLDIHAILKKL